MRGRSWDLDKPDKRMRDFCKANKIPFLALEPVFRKYTREEGRPLHWQYDGHWNVEGNDVAGKTIARFIQELM